MILNEPSSDTTARCRLSGENANALIRWFESFHAATGLNFWFLECTDLLICIVFAWLLPLTPLPLVVAASVSPVPFSLASSSGEKMASSFSLSYTTREPSMCAARKRVSEPGIHLISETGVPLMMPCNC